VGGRRRARWSHADVLPFFRRMEANERGGDAWRGDRGPQGVAEIRARWPITDAWIEAAQQAGIQRSPDLNGEHAEGVDHAQASQKNGLRHSTASAYLRGPRRPRGLSIELEAQATRLIVENSRAVGVDYLQHGARSQRARRAHQSSAPARWARRDCCCCRGWASGGTRGARDSVVTDLPGVGRNLQEHVGTHHPRSEHGDDEQRRARPQGPGPAAAVHPPPTRRARYFDQPRAGVR
jgi:choline dehydrogenase-like flavoprotein